MKKLTFVASLVFSASIIMNASAYDGVVSFTGKVVDQTCTVKTESKDLKVKLPTVSKKQLDTVGNTVGKTAFNIKVENCSAASPEASKVAAYFLPNAEYIDENTHNLKNTATSSKADNVQVRLLDNNFQPIQVGENIDTQYPASSNSFSTINGNAASVRYYAEYIATGSATPGNVTAKVEYDIVYK
ncbi:fimbrial protein [Haemophilus haemolyticus]|uniref:fimbrial protein n=1 Tax=Haemophilus haemolyticus TaxID=726 RepID=UPI00062D471A|nr:fimbrial protein [Haemophilus haemolyticus]KKZ55537.1 hypothetical protein AAX15_03690 [Haemophilus haemolyticus]